MRSDKEQDFPRGDQWLLTISLSRWAQQGASYPTFSLACIIDLFCPDWEFSLTVSPACHANNTPSPLRSRTRIARHYYVSPPTSLPRVPDSRYRICGSAIVLTDDFRQCRPPTIWHFYLTTLSSFSTLRSRLGNKAALARIQRLSRGLHTWRACCPENKLSHVLNTFAVLRVLDHQVCHTEEVCSLFQSFPFKSTSSTCHPNLTTHI